MFSTIVNIGTRSSYQEWENNIVRKINIIILIGTFNVISSAAIFFPIGIYDLSMIYLLMIVFTPLVFALNYYWHYLAGAYAFFIITGWLLFSINYTIGIESMAYLFFFPASYTMVQLFGRTELRIHVWLASTIYLFSFLATLMLKFREHPTLLTSFQLEVTSFVCIALSFISGLGIMILGNNDNIAQDNVLRKLVKDKELLLAEVFHRVKNNMSIVTGLLSLRKETAVSEEAKIALEDCKSRVYSMAIIHQQMLNSDEVGVLDFKQYIWELATNLNHSFGEVARIEINSVPVQMPISKAVPCGLILNELITNSYKHAIVPNRDLHIQVDVAFQDSDLVILVKDNGNGIPEVAGEKDQHSLGFDLIHSLCDQIDGHLSINNENGCAVKFHFNMQH